MAAPSISRSARIVVLFIISTAIRQTAASPGFDPRQNNANIPLQRHRALHQSRITRSSDDSSDSVLERENRSDSSSSSSSSSLALSKIFFFAGQPAISALLASRDHHRSAGTNNDHLVASSQSKSSLQLRGGVSTGAPVPQILALAKDIASVTAAALLGITVTLGERFFGMFGREVPAIVSQIHKYDKRIGATYQANNFFGGNSPARASSVDKGMPELPELSRIAIAFAVSSTLVGTCLVAAATTTLAINTEDVVSFAILNGLGVFVTYLGVVTSRGKLEWIDIMAGRGILPMGIALGLLAFLGIYA